MKNYSVRTDLALEEKERFASDNVEVQGVVLEEEYDEENEILIQTTGPDSVELYLIIQLSSTTSRF